MRVLVTWLLTLGLAVSPAFAGTGPGDEKDTTTKTSDTSTAAAKKADASTTAKSEAVKATPSTLENELQQLRDLLEAQSRQIQVQNDQLKEQQQKMMELETELKSETAARESFSSSAPDSRTAGLATASANPVAAANGSPNPDAVPGQAGEAPKAIYFKGITITPGGFLAAETVFRNKAIGADINTPFNNVPFPGNSGSQTTEFNASARQSRLSMLAEGRLASAKLTGYVETDFLGAGITSNNNESNSYVLRLRQGWGQAKFDNGWSFTGGQMWSLITETRKGVENRTEALPMTIDPQYTVGFSWARQYQFRVAKSFGDKFSVAASVEDSAITATVHGNPTITTLSTVSANQGGITTPTIATTVFNNFLIGAAGLSSGLYNPTGTYAYNKTPDFVFKAAIDPGWGHYEVFGVVSTFRDRTYPCYYANGGYNFPVNSAGESTLPGSDPDNPPVNIPATPCGISGPFNGSTNPTAGAFNDSRTGGGIGANARVPLLNKKIEAGIHVLGGSGIGRYGTAGLPDTTVRPDGTLALLRNYQALGTLEVHPTPKMDIYFNIGGEYSSRASYSYTNLVTGKAGTAGYGSPAFRNDGCFIEPLPVATPGNPPNTTGVLGSTGFLPGSLSNCAGDARNLIEGTMGFWYRIYNGDKGRIQWGPQYSYLVKNTWSGVNGSGAPSSPHGIDNMVFTSFRYYLP